MLINYLSMDYNNDITNVLSLHYKEKLNTFKWSQDDIYNINFIFTLINKFNNSNVIDINKDKGNNYKLFYYYNIY